MRLASVQSQRLQYQFAWSTKMMVKLFWQVIRISWDRSYCRQLPKNVALPKVCCHAFLIIYHIVPMLGFVNIFPLPFHFIYLFGSHSGILILQDTNINFSSSLHYREMVDSMNDWSHNCSTITDQCQVFLRHTANCRMTPNWLQTFPPRTAMNKDCSQMCRPILIQVQSSYMHLTMAFISLVRKIQFHLFSFCESQTVCA